MRANASAGASPYVFSFSDDVDVPSGGQKAKNIAQTIFGQKVFKMEEFTRNADDSGCLLGSHSIRKYAATHARKCGCNKDEKDIWGRWKSKGQVSDVYDDVELPYPDAKVAEKLCIGGACFYLFPNEDSSVNGGVVDDAAGANIEMMKTFVLTQVVPNIQEFKHRIKTELQEILTASGVDVEGENYNPIHRVPVIVSGDQGSVFIDAIDNVEDDGGGGGGGAVVGGIAGGRPGAGMNAQLMAVHSLATQVRREVHEIKLSQVADRTWMQRNFGIVNTNMRRLGITAAVRVVQGAGAIAGAGVGGGGNNDDNMLAAAGLQNLARTAATSLSPCPRNLYDLWAEYMFGIGGRKPASQFTHLERGKSKHKYFRRNVIWRMVLRMVNRGLTSDTAIDHIYSVYGAGTSVTKIINAIIDDRKRGRLNPNLVM
ncbi:hypothetical protein MHU86_12517 [Fragilaria crotonensis]|nr:hypothetical protein MHU86_12517 [Fragilaria crotonensis]